MLDTMSGETMQGRASVQTLKSLVDMGFEESDARAALELANGNEQEALAALIR